MSISDDYNLYNSLCDSLSNTFTKYIDKSGKFVDAPFTVFFKILRKLSIKGLSGVFENIVEYRRIIYTLNLYEFLSELKKAYEIRISEERSAEKQRQLKKYGGSLTLLVNEISNFLRGYRSLEYVGIKLGGDSISYVIRLLNQKIIPNFGFFIYDQDLMNVLYAVDNVIKDYQRRYKKNDYINDDYINAIKNGIETATNIITNENSHILDFANFIWYLKLLVYSINKHIYKPNDDTIKKVKEKFNSIYEAQCGGDSLCRPDIEEIRKRSIRGVAPEFYEESSLIFKTNSWIIHGLVDILLGNYYSVSNLLKLSYDIYGAKNNQDIYKIEQVKNIKEDINNFMNSFGRDFYSRINTFLSNIINSYINKIHKDKVKNSVLAGYSFEALLKYFLYRYISDKINKGSSSKEYITDSKEYITDIFEPCIDKVAEKIFKRIRSSDTRIQIIAQKTRAREKLLGLLRAIVASLVASLIAYLIVTLLH